VGAENVVPAGHAAFLMFVDDAVEVVAAAGLDPPFA
jgi:hypothetical protein